MRYESAYEYTKLGSSSEYVNYCSRMLLAYLITKPAEADVAVLQDLKVDLHAKG